MSQEIHPAVQKQEKPLICFMMSQEHFNYTCARDQIQNYNLMSEMQTGYEGST